MFKSKGLLLLAASVAVLAGCAAKAPDVAAITAMIRTHTTGWVDAYNVGDADKVMASYAEDAVLMPPEAPSATGREAIRQYLTGDMSSSKAAGTSFALDSDSVGVSGNLAWHSGTFHMNGPAGSPVGTGKYLEVWQQDAKGNWMMIRDTWNTDAPAAAPMPPPEAAPKAAAAKTPAPKKKHHKK